MNKMCSSALNLLSVYNNSDSDSENEVPGARASVKRCHSNDEDVKKLFKTESSKLPVPALLKQQEESSESDTESRNNHGGRIRTYPHERGNWSTCLFIKYEPNDIIQELINEIMLKCKQYVDLKPADNLHISLTRTVVLRHHWIEPISNTIKEKLTYLKQFLILFDKLKVYCNDERTRTFIGLQIQTGYDSLAAIVDILNICFKEYNLPEFYKDPSFHMSLVWCVGDYEHVLNNIIEDLNQLFDFMSNYPQYICAKQITFKSGNILRNFNLKTE